LKRAFITTFTLFALLGCNTTPIQIVSYEDQPIKRISSHGVSIEEIEIDIRMAAARAGWDITPAESPKRMIATRIDGNTSATVAIDFDLRMYSIRYKDSTGLGYLNGCTGKTSGGPIKVDGKCISPVYNEWVTGLNDEISRSVQY
jgi:hypothetical protein